MTACSLAETARMLITRCQERIAHSLLLTANYSSKATSFCKRNGFSVIVYRSALTWPASGPNSSVFFSPRTSTDQA